MWNSPGHRCIKQHLRSKRSTDKSTNIPLPRPLKTIYSVHRCFRWHLQSSIVPGTWWTGIAFHVSLTYLHRNSTEMKHARTRSIWGILCHNSTYMQHTRTGSLRGILCHNQVELLPPRFGYHGKKWLQAFAEVLNGKNANNKVNHWSLELATYNITFEWISAAHKKQWTAF